MKRLTDSPELRKKRANAYAEGKYKFRVPPVCTANWSEEAWCNWVSFDNPELTGFLPYTATNPFSLYPR